MSLKKKSVIAVTGVGGGVGQSIIKSLYGSSYKIIGMDSETLGTGLYTVPKAYKIPYASDSHYINSLLDICSKEKCSLLFPGLDVELSILSQNADKFVQIGTTVIISRPEAIEICDDKLLTSKFLVKIGLPAPKTYTLKGFLANPHLLNFPIILKPKKGGARSKDVYKVDSKTDLNKILVIEKLLADNLVVQEYIDGDEYTCGTVNLDQKYFGSIIMRRTLRDGDTYKCFTEKNPTIESSLSTIMKNLKPFGACNVQLRLKDNIPYVFELNARCSGTTAARAIAGFNEPRSIADYLLHHKKPVFKTKTLTIFRYWKELVIDNKQIEKISKIGQIFRTQYPQL